MRMMFCSSASSLHYSILSSHTLPLLILLHDESSSGIGCCSMGFPKFTSGLGGEDRYISIVGVGWPR
jgi:hypothetical protein